MGATRAPILAGPHECRSDGYTGQSVNSDTYKADYLDVWKKSASQAWTLAYLLPSAGPPTGGAIASC